MSVSLILKLANLPQHAVRELEGSGRGVTLLAVPGDASSHPQRLPDVFHEYLPLGAVSPQRDRRVGLKRPVLHLAAGILYIHVEIRVGALPVEFREDAGELFAILAVELCVEGMMRKRRRRQQEQTAGQGRRA